MCELSGIKPGATEKQILYQLFEDCYFGMSLQAWLCCIRCEEHLLNILPIFVTLLLQGIFEKFTEVHLHYCPQTALADLPYAVLGNESMDFRRNF